MDAKSHVRVSLQGADQKRESSKGHTWARGFEVGQLLLAVAAVRLHTGQDVAQDVQHMSREVAALGHVRWLDGTAYEAEGEGQGGSEEEVQFARSGAAC